MKVIHWLDKYFEEALSAALLAAMSIVILLQIVLKWLNMPLSWSEEMARYMFIWLIYVASAYAVKNRAHIKVEIVSLLLKEKGNFVLDVIADVAFFAFTSVIAYFGWRATYNIAFVHVQQSPSMHINMGWAYLSVALGCTLMAIRIIQDLVKRNKEYKEFKASQGSKALTDAKEVQ